MLDRQNASRSTSFFVLHQPASMHPMAAAVEHRQDGALQTDKGWTVRFAKEVALSSAEDVAAWEGHAMSGFTVRALPGWLSGLSVP